MLLKTVKLHVHAVTYGKSTNNSGIVTFASTSLS